MKVDVEVAKISCQKNQVLKLMASGTSTFQVDSKFRVRILAGPFGDSRCNGCGTSTQLYEQTKSFRLRQRLRGTINIENQVMCFLPRSHLTKILHYNPPLPISRSQSTSHSSQLTAQSS